MKIVGCILSIIGLACVVKPIMPKKDSGRPREDDWKILNGIFISFLQAASGNHCQDVMEHQAQYMIDFRNGKKGTKRSILTNAKGIPLSVVVNGANRHDKMLVILKMAKSSVKPGLSYFMGVI